MQNPCHEQCFFLGGFCGPNFLHLWQQEKFEVWKKIAKILEKLNKISKPKSSLIIKILILIKLN
jgi:hypothetical protein